MAAGGEFLVSLYPHFTKPFGEAHDMEYGIGGGLKVTYRPIKFLNLFAQGDYLSMAMPGIDPISIIQGGVGTGYHLDVTDRIAFDLNMNIGVYNAKASKNLTGISAGGALTFSYKFNPVISADVTATANHFAQKSSPLMMLNAGLAPGITFNVTQFFNNRTKLDINVTEMSPVFPVLYSWYENNSFGKVTITNKEDSAIQDIIISFYQPQYMTHAKECATIRKIEKDATAEVDLVAFFNEQMLELTEKADTSSYVIVNYSLLGKKLSQTYALDVPVYGRNNMSWDDDRRAAVFVSSKDPAAMQFGKYTASIVRDNLRVDVPLNIQYALGIFEALNQFGLNYVVDPLSAFEDNVGTSSIDFLQFPYQTLMYRGGDCDDLSILVCSLFEAVGIDTAFITVPGHIFMAFNAGISPEMAKTVFRNTSEFIFVDDEVWVPLEITLSDEGFYKACRYGAREWNTANANGTAALYKMSDSWKLYQPISVPGATAYFNMPDSKAIALAFANGMDQWSRGELKTLAVDSSVKFVMLDEKDETSEPELVLKGNPLSSNSLKDIVALANKSPVLPTAAIREEELEDDDENDEDELLEDVLPLDFAIATLQTDSAVVERPSNSEVEIEEDAFATSHSELVSESNTDTYSEYDIFEPKTVENESESAVVELSQSDSIETTEEENPFASLESMALAFLEENPETQVYVTPKQVAKKETPVAEKSSESPVVEWSQSDRIETTATTESPVVESTTESPVIELPRSGSIEITADSDDVVSIRPSDYSNTGDTATTGDTSDYKFETTDDFLTDLEAAEAKGRHPELDSGSKSTGTRNILIITSVTLAAALAAGIIIYGKKKREGEK